MKRLLFLITFLFASTAYTAEIYFSPGEGYTDAVLEQIYYAIAEDETRGQDYAEAHQDPVEEESACHILSHEKLVHRGTRESNDLKKLEMTNRFFNERMIYDEDAWGDKYYWATPAEFLSKGVGNCKDYAIAKFFTLKAMGVAESKLNLTYAKALRYNKAHLSLTYYSNPGADPLILDNMIDEILPGYEREDLVPVFSFNSSGLWLASQRGRGRHVGSPDRLGGWMDMLKRMSRTGGSAAPHRENNGSRTANFDSVFEAHPMAVPSHSH